MERQSRPLFAVSGSPACLCRPSGEFEGEDVTDDVTGLEPRDMKGLVEWRDFYHKASALLRSWPELQQRPWKEERGKGPLQA